MKLSLTLMMGLLLINAQAQESQGNLKNECEQNYEIKLNSNQIILNQAVYHEVDNIDDAIMTLEGTAQNDILRLTSDENFVEESKICIFDVGGYIFHRGKLYALTPSDNSELNHKQHLPEQGQSSSNESPASSTKE